MFRWLFSQLLLSLISPKTAEIPAKEFRILPLFDRVKLEQLFSEKKDWNLKSWIASFAFPEIAPFMA